jgi:hypothetical protein
MFWKNLLIGLAFLMTFSIVPEMSVEANLFKKIAGKVKKTVKKTVKKVKKTGKKTIKKVKKVAKKVDKTAKKTVKKAGKTLKKATKTIAKIGLNPIKCLSSGGFFALDTVKLLKSMLATPPIPKISPSFCGNGVRAMRSCGAKGMMTLIGKKLGGKKGGNLIKDIDKTVSKQVCGCLTNVINFAEALETLAVTKDSCAKAKKVVACCRILKPIPLGSKACKIMEKAYKKTLDKGCRKILGTCPVLVSGTALLSAKTTVGTTTKVASSVAKIGGAIAAMVAGSATVVGGGAAIVSGIVDAIDAFLAAGMDIIQLCKNVKAVEKKKCCSQKIAKMVGLSGGCSKIVKISNQICKKTSCLLYMSAFVRRSNCENLSKVMASNCCKQISSIPLPFASPMAKMCRQVESGVMSVIKKTQITLKEDPNDDESCYKTMEKKGLLRRLSSSNKNSGISGKKKSLSKSSKVKKKRKSH